MEEYPLDEERAKKAYEALVKYLAASMRSEHECSEKLYSKGFHRNEVEYAIERAKSHRYIDDEEYVAAYLGSMKDRYGMKKLAYKLTVEKGISRELVDRLVIFDEDEEADKCRRFAEAYISKKKLAGRSDAGKLSQYLYQKGFEWKIINRVVADCFDVFDD